MTAVPRPAPSALVPSVPEASSAAVRWKSIPRWAYLGAGAAAIPLASLKWNLAPLAWFAPVPLLLYLRRYADGWPSRFLLLAALLAGYNLMMLKILTDPVPWMMVPGYGIPLALAMWGVYLAWDALRSWAGDRWALYAFPALVALAELIGYRVTEFGVWGASANTQLDHLRLLQLASVTGMSGIGFAMAWFASLVALLLVTARRRELRPDIAGLVIVLLAIHAYGSWRIHAEQPGDTVRVAGIVADLGPTASGLPDAAALERNTAELFARTEVAASRGARVVVWNEAATVVAAPAESVFVNRGREIARRHGIDLVLAYIVPLAESRSRFENKYVWLAQDGAILETYWKHHPVPGEGSVRGEAPLRLIRRPYAAAAGAICYDYDFPVMARTHARLGAGLVLLPSSDWRGIDPLHTQMARIRAIEGGFSVVRPVRWATSGAFDAYGRSRASMSHFEANDRIMMATVPVEPVATWYARIGDAPALGYALIVLGSLLSGWRLRARRTGRAP